MRTLSSYLAVFTLLTAGIFGTTGVNAAPSTTESHRITAPSATPSFIKTSASSDILLNRADRRQATITDPALIIRADNRLTDNLSTNSRTPAMLPAKDTVIAENDNSTSTATVSQAAVTPSKNVDRPGSWPLILLGIGFVLYQIRRRPGQQPFVSPRQLVSQREI